MMQPVERTTPRADRPSAPSSASRAAAKPASRRRAPGPPGNYGVRNLVAFARDQLGLLRGLKDTYGDVAPGELLAYPGSVGFVEIAARDGSAAERIGAARGAPVTALRGA